MEHVSMEMRCVTSLNVLENESKLQLTSFQDVFLAWCTVKPHPCSTCECKAEWSPSCLAEKCGADECSKCMMRVRVMIHKLSRANGNIT